MTQHHYVQSRSTILVCLANTLIGNQPDVGKRPAIEILEDIGLLYSLSTSEYLERNIQVISPIVITSERNETLIKLVRLRVHYFAVVCA